MLGWGAAEATDLGFVYFVVLNLCVLSANRIDLVFFFINFQFHSSQVCTFDADSNRRYRLAEGTPVHIAAVAVSENDLLIAVGMSNGCVVTMMIKETKPGRAEIEHPDIPHRLDDYERDGQLAVHRWSGESGITAAAVDINGKVVREIRGGFILGSQGSNNHDI